MTDTSVLSMLDLTLEEFESLYFANEGIFRSVNNWFYFANDEKRSPLASKGYVRYGRNRGRRKALGFPEDDFGGLVLLCRSDIDLDAVRKRCIEEKTNVIHFELEDGTRAHYGIVNDAIGVWGPNDKEHILIIIPNKPKVYSWPYSMNGNTTFETASKEEGTLPYDVATGRVERMIPNTIKEDLGIL